MIQANASTMFTPSSEKLLQMIKDAESRYDADKEQFALRAEQKANDRMERAILSETIAIRRRRIYG